ncbi:MAG: hypothetical protein OXP08_00480, partial [bacterium]|nr:hypothetical protein [bacterium]
EKSTSCLMRSHQLSTKTAQLHVESTATANQALHMGCLIRQDGTPWRSGSTYVVILTPNGTVFIHAQDMIYSGRRLRPEIHGAILRALGADPANPAGILPALTEATSGSGGAFDVPGIAGASGYAAPYFAGLLQLPMIALTGFDLDESHVLEELIDHVTPAVTARDVVDRETLKAFVIEAGEFYKGIQESGDPAAFPKARSAMRDPNGPWRHGSVYLYVLDLTSNIIRIHGAFPNRYEFNYLVPLARDAISGKLVLPQVLEVAASSPEGGFLEYHFDDPTDPNDSSDTPKLGYAREFTSTIVAADGSGREVTFVVGSGVYMTYSPELAMRTLGRLDDGRTSMLFSITTPAPGNTVAGNALAVSAAGAPSDTVHFAFRPTDPPDAAFTYLGAAFTREDEARFVWDTADLSSGGYELVALYTEGEDDAITYDSIEVNFDNDAEAPDIRESRGSKTQALQADVPNEVVTANRVVVSLPAGALAADDRITIGETGAPDPATVPGDAVGNGIRIALASGQETFHEEVTISLPYSEGPLEEMDISEDGLSMWFFDAATETWMSVSGSMPQPDADRVVADVTHTGEFAIFDAPVMMADDGRGDGGCVAVPVLSGGGGPLDPTLPALVGLALAYLLLVRRRPAALAGQPG